MINKTVVPAEICRLFWCLAALQVFRSSDKKCCGRPDPPGNERGIADLADANLEIDPFLDEIAELVVEDEIDRQLFLLLQQGAEIARDVETERDGDAEADTA